uniref:THAP-type domain-containing protein n=1 Tax=Xiphophorus maculatus TaxID=8083 RepID=A0A3B5QUX6_XIPMA
MVCVTIKPFLGAPECLELCRCDMVLSFMPCRFPKDEEQRKKWLQVAQRDEASLRTNSYICSRHFEMSCFTLTEEGQLVLSPDAAPTLLPVTAHGNEVTLRFSKHFIKEL